jgi:hypothetical protein
MLRRAPTPRELAMMASRFPSLHSMPLCPWNASRIAAAFRRRFDDADGALHLEGGRAAAVLAILFRLDPCTRVHARRSEAVRFILGIDPVGLIRWWDEPHWHALLAMPLRWRRLR